MPIIVPAPVLRLSPTSWIASARVPVSCWPGRASEPRQRIHTTVSGWSTARAVCTSTSEASLCRVVDCGSTTAVSASTAARTPTRRTACQLREMVIRTRSRWPSGSG